MNLTFSKSKIPNITGKDIPNGGAFSKHKLDTQLIANNTIIIKLISR